MIGTILDVDPKTNAGILRADDGQRYRFAGPEWKSSRRPANGDKVDFEVVGGAATALYVLGGGGAPIQMPSPQKSEILTFFSTTLVEAVTLMP